MHVLEMVFSCPLPRNKWVYNRPMNRHQNRLGRELTAKAINTESCICYPALVCVTSFMHPSSLQPMKVVHKFTEQIQVYPLGYTHNRSTAPTAEQDSYTCPATMRFLYRDPQFRPTKDSFTTSSHTCWTRPYRALDIHILCRPQHPPATVPQTY